jgi:hypothetical protein
MLRTLLVAAVCLVGAARASSGGQSDDVAQHMQAAVAEYEQVQQIQAAVDAGALKPSAALSKALQAAKEKFQSMNAALDTAQTEGTESARRSGAAKGGKGRKGAKGGNKAELDRVDLAAKEASEIERLIARDASRERPVPPAPDAFDFSIVKNELAYLPEEREILALLGGYEATA